MKTTKENNSSVYRVFGLFSVLKLMGLLAVTGIVLTVLVKVFF